jgi:hypothetical protein
MMSNLKEAYNSTVPRLQDWREWKYDNRCKQIKIYTQKTEGCWASKEWYWPD